MPIYVGPEGLARHLGEEVYVDSQGDAGKSERGTLAIVVKTDKGYKELQVGDAIGLRHGVGISGREEPYLQRYVVHRL